MFDFVFPTSVLRPPTSVLRLRRHGVDALAHAFEIRAQRRQPGVRFAQLLAFGADEAAVGGDALAHPRRAAPDLLLELLAERGRQSRADVGDLPSHLGL